MDLELKNDLETIAGIVKDGKVDIAELPALIQASINLLTAIVPLAHLLAEKIKAARALGVVKPA